MSHYYKADGSTAYEVQGANGKMRPTTIRDARKLGLVPSVTTIMSVQDKPGLLLWKQEQLLLAALKSPFCVMTDEPNTWKSHMRRAASAIGKTAAENGTRIHDAIEEAIKNNFKAVDNNLVNIVEPVLAYLKEHFVGYKFIAEDSFCHPAGFGGKIDLYGIKDAGTENEKRMVLDFKTKNKTSEEMTKIKAYDDHHLQTAAYVKGLEDTKNLGRSISCDKWGRYNLFIGYDIDADDEFKLTGLELTESTNFEREWGMFEKLLQFWQLKNNYDPRGVL